MAAHTENSLRVSLVIPVRNEQESLSELLSSISGQRRKPDEIVFVDGGSTDETVKLLKAAAERDSSIRVVEAGPATPGRGRNVGIENAQHEWIAFTDGGIRVEPDWLSELLAKADATVDVIYGSYRPTTDSFFERCAALLYAHPTAIRDGLPMRGPFIASSLLQRQAWEKAGGFPDLRASEDLIFMERLEQLGCRIAWAPKAVVWWRPQSTVSGTFGRFAAFSRANVWAGRERQWHLGIARAYLISLLFLVLAVVHSYYWLLAPVLIFVLRAAKSIWQRREGRGIVWALNPIQFVGVTVLLLAIDLGTLVGWIQARLFKQGRPAKLPTNLVSS